MVRKFKLYDSELNEIADVPNESPYHVLLLSYFDMTLLGSTEKYDKYKIVLH